MKPTYSAFMFELKPLVQLLSLAVLTLGAQHNALAQTAMSTPTIVPAAVDLGTIGGSTGSGAATTTSVKAEAGTAAAIAPAQANLNATQPQSIVSRAFIENSTPPNGNFNTILSIAPGIASMPATNGPGLSDTKMTMRGFQDGEYNVTFDGIPFGDTNGPTHHATAYFPASVIGGMVIERGPGNASNIGYSTYAGSVNIFSKAPSATQQTSVFGSIGSWGTKLAGFAYETGRIAGSDATFQFNLQNLTSNGYTTGSGIDSQQLTLKYQRPVGDATLMTAFSSLAKVNTNVTDNASGATLAQVAVLGKNYVMNNDPASMGYKGYNIQHKNSDMEYLRLQTSWGNGWQTDNNSYTYAYRNQTIAGQDPSQYNGTSDTLRSYKQWNGTTVTPATGVLAGYDKLNEYRVFGNVFKATKQMETGLLRAGVWIENSVTQRHNLEKNLLTGEVLSGVTSSGGVTSPNGIVTATNFNRQDSAWHNVQPFVEYEWKATPTMTITPGYKHMSNTIQLASDWNQGSSVSNAPGVAQSYNFNYKANLPYLSINNRIDAQNSVYAQYAKGMQTPFVNNGLPNSVAPAPQTTTNYQIGVVHKDDRLTADADIYYIPVNNLYSALASSTLANPIYANGGAALYKGLEGQITYKLDRAWAVHANGNISSARYSDVNDTTLGYLTGQVAGAPVATNTLGILYNQGPWNASLMYKSIGHQYNKKSAAQLAPINNADLNVAYTFLDVKSLGVKAMRVQMSVFNLTNAQSVIALTGLPTASATQYQWQAPRSLMLSLKADF
jgi:iron complex outermembrane receptor protein